MPMELAKGRPSADDLLDGSIILLLAQKSDYGYTLVQRLADIGIDVSHEKGILYRRLRALERRGLLEHYADRSKSGPARKVYQPTCAGYRALDDWVEGLPDVLAFIQSCLSLHGRLREWVLCGQARS
jgi:PadR family transcriptional regulator, regulatory protein PadR